MRTARVIVGSESSKGASMMMSKATAVAERTRDAKRDTNAEPVPKKEIGTTPLPKELLGPAQSGTKFATLESMPSRAQKETNLTFIDDICPNPIDRVDENIYIGNYIGASELDYLRNNGITHVINTAAELPNYHEKTTGIKYFNITLFDDSTPNGEKLLDLLDPSFETIKNILKDNPRARILVHCAAGMSRSASIVMYYLMRRYSQTYDEALDNLKQCRWLVKPNTWYEIQLRQSMQMKK